MNSAVTKVPKRGGFWNTLLYVILLPVYLVAKVIPKNPELYLFGSRYGIELAENTKYLFLNVAKNVEDARCVFVSRNREVVRLLQDNGYHALYIFSLAGIATAVRAKKCFVSHSTYDIHALLIGGAEIIQLWHGTPLKKIGYDAVYQRKGKLGRIKSAVRSVLFNIFPYLNTSMVFDRLVISSENVKDSFKTAFCIRDQRISVLGQPRNDALAEDYEFDRSIFPEMGFLDSLKARTGCLITWMPTHRMISGGLVANLLTEYSFDAEKLAAFLGEHDAHLIIKVHPLDRQGLKGIFQDSDRITTYPYADAYPLLRFTDILMTDYSSVCFDFLLTNRPIVFTSFDYDAYVRDDASFYYDYTKVTPGYKCRDWNEVLRALKEHAGCLAEDKADPFCEERAKTCRMFNDYAADNARRVIETFIRPRPT
jgi:CDP-glycerol glycerophosphotransferase (TagB/SpsB family)